MIQQSIQPSKRRVFAAALALCAAVAMTFVTTAQAQAGGRHGGQPIANEADPVENGALLFHGNYCGPGNHPGTRPIDALDAACMHHDFCGSSEGLKSCACNASLQREAEAVAQDPSQPPDLQMLAGVTAAGSALLICDHSPQGFYKSLPDPFKAGARPQL
jgi:hypothetical protein